MRKWIVVAVLMLGSAGAARAQELDALSKWAAIAFNELHLSQNIVYQRANNSSLKLDVISAGPSQARPTLIYFHGGGWLEGSKDGVLLYALPYLARGMNAVNVEYRMAPESLAPAAVEDCRCALHWVYDHAKQYGFDTSKLVVEGHSAGGHLALITGMLDAGAGFDNECTRPSEEWRQGFIRDVRVAAIVNFFGPGAQPAGCPDREGPGDGGGPKLLDAAKRGIVGRRRTGRQSRNEGLGLDFGLSAQRRRPQCCAPAREGYNAAGQSRRWGGRGSL